MTCSGPTRRNTTAKQMTPFGVFMEGCGRVMPTIILSLGRISVTKATLRPPEEALMLHTVSPLILQLSLFLMTAVATHLVMSVWADVVKL
jgi:hypothetical protein